MGATLVCNWPLLIFDSSELGNNREKRRRSGGEAPKKTARFKGAWGVQPYFDFTRIAMIKYIRMKSSKVLFKWVIFHTYHVV